MATSTDPTALAAALQLSDSALPLGRFAHSYGLESLLGLEPELGDDGIAEVVGSAVLEAGAPLDGVAVAAAHRATSIRELMFLDAEVTARKLAPGARAASTSAGRRLAALAPELCRGEPAAGFAAAVCRGESDGNLAVVHGAVAAAMGLSAGDAVLVELRGLCAGLLAAAVRLGRLSSLRAQAIQRRLAAALASAAVEAAAGDLEAAYSSALELELASLRHGRADTRHFAT